MFKKTSAFSLAEVLIALFLIGVIAAETIPPLVNSVHQRSAVAGVFKYKSIFQQAINMYAMDNDCSGNMRACDDFDHAYDEPHYFGDKITDYFVDVKNCSQNTGQGCFPKGVIYKYLNGTDNIAFDDRSTAYKFIVGDGALVTVWISNGNCERDQSIDGSGPLTNVCGGFTVDTNGVNPPNTTGRDHFPFIILSTGEVWPVGTSNDTGKGCDPSSSDLTMDSNGAAGRGHGCTAKIIQEHAMNY